jgi:hypothetical protein
MKVPFYLRLPMLAAFFLCLALPTFSQTNAFLNILDGKPAKAKVLAKPTKLLPQTLPALKKPAATDCNNDLVAPEIYCPGNEPNPFAVAAYLTSQYGEPWGLTNNIDAMDAVFGIGNWYYDYMEFADPSIVLSSDVKVLFLEGSDVGGFVLNDFLSANLPALENWVAAGGALFINCAPTNYNAPSTMNLGFGGVTVTNFRYTYVGLVQEPSHPIFNGPFSPANGDFTGNQYHLSILSGDVGEVLITGEFPTDICLTEKTWGSGKVFFSTITLPSWTGPQPNNQNMWQNILVNLNENTQLGAHVYINGGECSTTVWDQALDATATDDCALASLTHDFAGAPSNTTLAGAVLPAGKTTVKWIATDASGNTSDCESVIWVREPVAPTINCPQDITVNADLGNCFAVLEFSFPAADDCTANPTVSSFPSSGGQFPNGTSIVVARATDDSGNTGTCAFLVNVIPNPEICNGIDDNCDGWVDEDVTEETTFYLDADYDGFGNPEQTTTAFGCNPPWGYTNNALDCDDANYYINPNMWEYCNGIDDNCDGNIDEGVAPTWYADADGDGYGDANIAQISCDAPQGFVSNNWDCVDTDGYIHPGAPEDCTNLTDENCDGILGENNFGILETHTDVFCGSNPDGSISISMTPAQNYPLIRWSNGDCCSNTILSNLNYGTYTVTVTNECGTSKTKTIVIQPSAEPPLQVAMTGTDKICGGTSDGVVTATPSDGCGGYTYLWSTGGTDASISNLTGGDYTVVVTDACGCTRLGAFTVNQSQPLSIYFGAIIPLLDGTYFVETVPYGGFAPYQFRRSTPPTGYTAWSGSNGFLGVPAGDYVFEVEDANGCTAQTSISLSPLSPSPLTDPNGTESETGAEDRKLSGSTNATEKAWSVSLFPNPNTGNFNIDLHQAATLDMRLGITDLQGRLVFEKQLEPGSQLQPVNAENIPAGLYFLQVVANGKVVAVEKFVCE